MKFLLTIVLLLATLASSQAAVNLAVSQQSGAEVQERASQLARQLAGKLGTAINVVALPDNNQVELWLNRYATAELALVENGFIAGKPGQFVVIGAVGRDLTLIGRQGIAGDLPQRIAAVLEGGGGQPVPAVVTQPPAGPVKSADRTGRPATAPKDFSPSKSISEDRYFVTYVYREKFGKEPDPERLEYWAQQLRNGGLSKQEFYEKVCRQGAALCVNSE